MKLRYTTFDMPTGLTFAAATEKGLARLVLRVRTLAECMEELEAEYGETPVEDDRPFRTLKRELARYFAGRKVSFTARLDPNGTDFQKTVWRALMEVPYGEVRSYKWLAEVIGRPNGSRAVGGALGQNRIPIIIPCHRIVASSGGLGGYSGGIDIKRKLLEIEGAHPPFSLQ